ncbi:pyridoxal phosphate-dependent decarboxylase family protein [Leisingera sp. ANG-Vp]|uniref:pyridoxal phosphate-dependent decarboxylase family protein n=1 Tax=Leisingera sp. ANG-Vp TaxID=1577896 RepID=UPI00187BDF3F|nr:aminotransferase class V-fold PLP-dependent enzyme [Leisingera sp. ANG-Vp]
MAPAMLNEACQDPNRIVSQFEETGQDHDTVMQAVRNMHDFDRTEISLRKGQLSCWAMAPTALMKERLLETPAEAAKLYLNDNLFYRRLHPSIGHMYDSVMGMARVVSGIPKTATGAFTLGGTESNILAVLGAREWAKQKGKDPSGLNIVMSNTAHLSIDKAAHYFGLEIRRVPVGEKFAARAEDFRKRVDSNTAIIIGSAPDYCYGQYDPIEDLSELALEHNTWLHVDGAIGAAYARTMRDLGESIPASAFDLDGVTSVSVDLHKHVYAPIGAGILFCREQEFTDLHTFSEGTWPVGLMVSTGMNGSPPASSLAGAYAVMRRLGLEGYRAQTAQIIHNRTKLVGLIEALDETRIFGNPIGTVVTFGWNDIDASLVAAAMEERDWKINQVSDPAGIHCTLDAFDNDPLLEAFAAAMAECADAIRAGYRPKTVKGATYG